MKSTFDIDNVESVRYFVDNWFADNWYEYNFHRMKTPLKGKEEVYPEDVEVYRSELFAALKGKKREAFNEALQHFIDSYPSSESDQYAMSYASPEGNAFEDICSKLSPREMAAVGLKAVDGEMPGGSDLRYVMLRVSIEFTNALCRKYRLPVQFKNKA